MSNNDGGKRLERRKKRKKERKKRKKEKEKTVKWSISYEIFVLFNKEKQTYTGIRGERR